MSLFKGSRGDTMVEVLLSAMILSSILAAAYSLTTRATLLNRVAFERTDVSAMIQQQAELLRSLRDNSDTNPTWNNQIVNNYTSTSAITLNCKNNPDFFNDPNAYVGNAYHIDDSANLVGGILIDNLYHIWIESTSPSGASYIDFYINACWENIDESENLSTGLVLRLQKAN